MAIEIAEEKREKNQAAAFKREAEKRGEPLDSETEKQVSATLHKPARTAKKEAAKMTGGKTGERQISDAKKLKAKAPDLFNEIKDGKKSVSQAKRDLNKRTRVVPPPIKGKYRVWYADPPWQYGNKGLDDYGHAERHYPTMSIAQLCDMGDEIKGPCETDAVLFLWVTSPLLEDAFTVIKVWSFVRYGVREFVCR